MSLKLALILSLGLATCLVTVPAHAYYSTIDNGELLSPGGYDISIEPQWITNRYEGLQDTLRFDAGLTEDSSVRALIGGGPVPFEIGGFYKWVPFPDVDNQPAIGGDLGAIVSRTNGSNVEGNEINIRFHPMISKRLESEIGDFIPYGSIPIGIDFRPDRTTIPIQLAGGCEFRPLNLYNLSAFAELGIDVNDAFGYFSVALAWRFDDKLVHRHGRRSTTDGISPMPGPSAYSMN